MMFKIFHNTAPEYLCNVHLVGHGHRTRNSCLSYTIPHVKTQGSKSFVFNGIKLWNNLPSYIRMLEDKCEFKMKCKSYLMKKMFDVEMSDYVV